MTRPGTASSNPRTARIGLTTTLTLGPAVQFNPPQPDASVRLAAGRAGHLAVPRFSEVITAHDTTGRIAIRPA